jgi:hypothetical protein
MNSRSYIWRYWLPDQADAGEDAWQHHTAAAARSEGGQAATPEASSWDQVFNSKLKTPLFVTRRPMGPRLKDDSAVMGEAGACMHACA